MVSRVVRNGSHDSGNETLCSDAILSHDFDLKLDVYDALCYVTIRSHAITTIE